MNEGREEGSLRNRGRERQKEMDDLSFLTVLLQN